MQGHMHTDKNNLSDQTEIRRNINYTLDKLADLPFTNILILFYKFSKEDCSAHQPFHSIPV